jgi:SAM-dependent methyltransferase
MTPGFDKEYWDAHWQSRDDGPASTSAHEPHPHLASEVGALAPGTALDAGCGRGAEAIWLATAGWQVTAVDISAAALAGAVDRAPDSGISGHVQWVEADLTTWDPPRQFDLVTTHYAHPTMPQLEFYERIAAWVAPGGSLLIVGHLDQEHEPLDERHHDGGHHHFHHHVHDPAHDRDHQPPAEASVTAADITALLDEEKWSVLTADHRHRTLATPEDRTMHLHDVVVRAISLS